MRLDRRMGAVGGTLHLALLNDGVNTTRGSGVAWLNASMTEKEFWVDAFDRALPLGPDRKEGVCQLPSAHAPAHGG